MRRLYLHDGIIICLPAGIIFFTVAVLSSFHAVVEKRVRSCKGITDKGKMRALGQMRTVCLVFHPFYALKGNLVPGESLANKRPKINTRL